MPHQAWAWSQQRLQLWQPPSPASLLGSPRLLLRPHHPPLAVRRQHRPPEAQGDPRQGPRPSESPPGLPSYSSHSPDIGPPPKKGRGGWWGIQWILGAGVTKEEIPKINQKKKLREKRKTNKRENQKYSQQKPASLKEPEMKTNEQKRPQTNQTTPPPQIKQTKNQLRARSWSAHCYDTK